jgi:hypothetical protein
MKQEILLKHQFVEFIPEELADRTLYISMRFATVSHLCACGCKTKVVTPLKPTDWKLTFDGKTITLNPSVGNWSFPCRSHYWIRNNVVEWAEDWSQARIDATRAHDRSAKERYFRVRKRVHAPEIPGRSSESTLPIQVKTPWWHKFRPW